MGENKIGLVPKVIAPGAMGPKEYGLLLTDQRSILVFHKKTNAVLGGAVGGVIGVLVADALTKERTVDYMNTSPEELARDDKNIVIPHGSLKAVRMKRHLGGGYSLRMEYSTPEGKERKVSLTLMVPEELAEQKRAQGIKAKAMADDYAQKVQDALKRALPAGAQQYAEWME